MMDGFSGIGVFRPHAYFYWFSDPEIVEMMTDEQILANFQTGKLAPRYIILDSFLDRVFSPIRGMSGTTFQWYNTNLTPLFCVETPAGFIQERPPQQLCD